MVLGHYFWKNPSFLCILMSFDIYPSCLRRCSAELDGS